MGVAALHGLHAAHEATDDAGRPLDIVHRDVSPQNILVGVDGMTRVIDFGVAKAARRLQTTQEGTIKGKLAYMAPEQLRGLPVTRAADIYAVGVVIWEALAGRRLFHGDSEAALLAAVLGGAGVPPSRHHAGLSLAVDRVVMKALANEPAARFATAREMADALTRALTPALPTVVGDWCTEMAAESLAQRGKLLGEIESASGMASVRAMQSAPRLLAPDLDADAVNTVQLPSNPSARAIRVPLETSGLTGSGLSSGASIRIPGVSPQPRRALWGGGAAVLLLAALGAYALGTKKASTTAVPPAPPLAAAPAMTSASPIPAVSASAVASSASEPSPPEAPSAHANTADVLPSVAPASSKPANSAPKADRGITTSASRATRVGPGAPKAATPATSSAADHCKPNYFFDANGDKHFKPECFGQ